jgi:uncharacterized caspase-like protein
LSNNRKENKMAKNRKALIIGNDNYQNVSKLNGCKNDTISMGYLLKNNEDGTGNFSTQIHNDLSNESIKEEIEQFLKRKCSYALIYYSGHGYINEEGGYLCGIDASKENFGVSMKWLSQTISDSEIPEITIILDCCHAGEMFNVSVDEEFALLKPGVTVLAATTKNDTAAEFCGKGVFTSILVDGLKGAAKDILGNVSITGLYACAENMLSPFQQRPVFKSFVDQITPLRKCIPLVSEIDLKKLITDEFFPIIDFKIEVNPDILNQKKAEFDISFDTFLMLGTYEKAGLLECDSGKTLIETTLEWGECRLSTYGKHVWQLVKKDRINK